MRITEHPAGVGANVVGLGRVTTMYLCEGPLGTALMCRIGLGWGAVDACGESGRRFATRADAEAHAATFVDVPAPPKAPKTVKLGTPASRASADQPLKPQEEPKSDPGKPGKLATKATARKSGRKPKTKR